MHERLKEKSEVYMLSLTKELDRGLELQRGGGNLQRNREKRYLITFECCPDIQMGWVIQIKFISDNNSYSEKGPQFRFS